MTQDWKQWEGQVLNGEFHLRQYLGGTEHSAVFLTEDQEQGLQKAAIKLIPSDPEKDEFQLSRWRAAAKLSHPHLIRLFQMGRCQLGGRDLLYLVMAYAELDLSQVLSKGPIPPEETRETLKLTLNALAYLHGKGFVHGHLKPANIMSANGQLKLSSDGICWVGNSVGSQGTQGDYDPPEASSGINSPAGDVWSLGVILAETLLLRPPVSVRTEERDSLLPPTLPAPFFDIARNCLRRDPERRWTVAEIQAHLERTPAGPPLPVPKPEISARRQKVFLKWRYIVPTAALGLVLAAILAGPKLLNRHRAQPKPDQSPVTHSTRPVVEKTSAVQQRPSVVVPPHSSVRSGTASRVHTGNVVRAGIRQKVLPDVPQSASDTIRGTVRVSVKVSVDPSGNVVQATLVAPGPSRYFAKLSLEAARRWNFWPAEVGGRLVSKEWILQFDFTRTATDAFLVQAAP